MSKARGPYSKGVAKREEILRVALEVVSENGYHNTLNRDIAERAGLSPTGLMHYFGSKEELFIEVLRARDRHDVATFWDPRRDFRGFLDVIAHNATVPGLVQLYIEYSAEASFGKHPAHSFFIERHERTRSFMREAIQKAQYAGELGPNVQTEEAANLIIASADGLQQQWLLDPSVDMVAHLERLWDLIRAGSWADEKSPLVQEAQAFRQ
ncbi:TetR/AcrR family transcriptional regulator [Kocuria coralli]|uniref:TetR/AcrR family transcriptional regulator n=1 Tax=Kocuria coralli TaxID=1461025 RepID=A0A5J5KXS6_9MICC|nr:TetR/AcrR family transcriptional regulator [Kocuria coralli]KAA9393695.1 TetR/AcrR family transcriptional regulator [Kocuria coralli]